MIIDEFAVTTYSLDPMTNEDGTGIFVSARLVMNEYRTLYA